MTRFGVKGARKSVQWTDVSPERGAPGRRPAVFTKNRDRLLATDVARKVLAAILAHREVAPLLSDEHFAVDGTLVKAWAWVSNRWRHHGSPSMKSFQPKPEAAPSGGDSPDDPPSPPPTAAVPATRRRCRCRCQILPGDRPDDHQKTQRSQCRSRLLRPEPVERDPCPGHRPGDASLQEVTGHWRKPVLHRAHTSWMRRVPPLVRATRRKAMG